MFIKPGSSVIFPFCLALFLPHAFLIPLSQSSFTSSLLSSAPASLWRWMGTAIQRCYDTQNIPHHQQCKKEEVEQRAVGEK